MSYINSAFLLVFLSAAGLAGAETRRAVFEGAAPEFKWALKDLNPGLPSDWSSYEYLVLEIRSSTSQRFELRLHAADGVRKLRMHPFQGAWIRAAVPLKYFKRPDRDGFDLASMGNKPRAAFWMNLMGSYGPLKAVEAISVAMENPIGKPTLEIRSVTLAQADPGDAVLEPKPLVDQFGQWIHAEWPSKATTLDELKKEWALEDKALPAGDFNYCRYGGYLGSKAKATGFFRVEQIDGKWWFVDPDGHLFFSTGVDSMSAWSGTPTEGRDGVFAAMPPTVMLPFNARPGRPPDASFYTWNLLRRFGPEWGPQWVDLTLRRMTAWGLNTVANWSDPRLAAARQKAYVATLRGWGMETGIMGLPDVYAPEFAQKADAAAAQQCASRKNDPYLLGYFVANEPPWPGRETQVVDAILEGRDKPIQRELKTFLAEGDTPERRKAFVFRTLEKMLEIVNAAIRKHDPNHLNLGIRFGGHPSDEVIRTARVFDVYSHNIYDYVPDRQYLEKLYQLTGRPIVIGEFHFGTPGRGLAAGLRQTRNQEERGAAYRYYVENAAAMPALIGTHWFQWIDQPPTGRMDGENYNIGIVDVTDRPYRELVEAMQATHKRLLGVHSGKEPPVSRKAEVQ
ncbi:MAG: hypothetical protein ABSH05_20680 [Bryobacteraceae bacterium]